MTQAVARRFALIGCGVIASAGMNLGDPPVFSADAGAAAIVGDFDGDGYGDLLVAGAADPGRISLFRGRRNGVAKTAAWSVAGDRGEAFGYALAGAGDVNGDGLADVIVGAPDALRGTGRAVVFHGQAKGPPVRAWTAMGADTGDRFGAGVATAGDVDGDGFTDVLVRALGTDRRGRVSLFLGSKAGLAEKPAWVKNGAGPEDLFGRGLAAAGDVDRDGRADVLIGAPGATDRRRGEGAVFLYSGTSNGISLEPSWVATGGTSGSWFGATLDAGDVDGDGRIDVVVGGEGFEPRGQILLFRGEQGGIARSPAWAIQGERWERLGSALAVADVDGDHKADIVAGSRSPEGGRRVVFLGNAAFQPSRATWSTEPGASPERLFGDGVSSGDLDRDGRADVVLTAPAAKTGGTGRAHVYMGRALVAGSPSGSVPAARRFSGPNARPVWSFEGEGAHSGMGESAATGDVDGDGFDELILGEAPTNGRGRVFLFRGSRGGLAAKPTWDSEGESTWAHHGAAVAFLGDVNGDGFGDVAVGSDRTGSGWAGMVDVFLGSKSGLGREPVWTARGEDRDPAKHPSVSDAFGTALLAPGDVDGDGFADLVVASGGCGGGGACSRLYRGRKTGLALEPAWKAAGTAIATGDVNGDGLGDVLLAIRTTLGNQPATSLAIHLRDGIVFRDSPWWTSPVISNWQIAAALADVNADGIADLLVAGTTPRTPQRDAVLPKGFLSCFLGTPSGPRAVPDWTWEAPSRLGESLHVTDLDGDGRLDVLVGSRDYTNGERAEGAVFVFHAVGERQPAEPWVIEGNSQSADVGATITTMSDLDGDGAREIVASGPNWPIDFPRSSGRALLYRGRPPGSSSHAASAGDLRVVERPLFAESDAHALPDLDLPYSRERIGGAIDVNGDGRADLLRGSGTERPSIQLGTAAGFGGISPLSMLGDESQRVELEGAGDVNRDGFGDVLAGVQGDPEVRGEAVLLLGGTGGLASASSWKLRGSARWQQLGCSFAGVGDVDGDGFDDVLVGSPACNPSFSAANSVMLFRGSRSGLAAEPVWTLESNSPFSRLGEAMLGGFDVNRDGFADFVISDPRESVAGSQAGEAGDNVGGVRLFLGGRSGPVQTVWHPHGAEYGESYGAALAVGDVTGDGVPDLAVGAPGKSGRMQLFRGTTTGFSSEALWTLEARDRSWEGLGSSIALADVDGDGHADLITTRPGEWDIGARVQVGRLDVFKGHSGGLSRTPAWSAVGTTAHNLGAQAVLVDANRDGRLDIVVGPPWRVFLRTP